MYLNVHLYGILGFVLTLSDGKWSAVQDRDLMNIEEQQQNNIRNVAFIYNTLNRYVLKTAETPYF